MLRVGIYLRLSEEDRNKKNQADDSESIKNQRNLLLSEIEKQENWVLVEEYVDEDLSGAGTYRPEFERLISDCEKKKIDVVFCKSQSRFSRDMEVIEKYLHNKFMEWNIRFISLSDHADTGNIGNKKARQINGLVNEWFLEDLSNNIKTAFKAKMKNGELISPFACYGYEIHPLDNNKLQVDEVAAQTVREIFRLYLKDYGFGKIAKTLNERNIPSPSFYKHLKGIKLNIISKRNIEDIKWSHNAIKTILTNEVYIGNLVQGKRTTISYKNRKVKKKEENTWIKQVHTHEAIIDSTTWESAQRRLQRRTRPCKKSEKMHLLSGKVYCAKCGRPLKKNATKSHQYLVCTSVGDTYEKCPNHLSIRYDAVEHILLDEIRKQVDSLYDETKVKIKKEYQGVDQEDSLQKQKQKLERKRNEQETYFKTLYKDRVEGIISKEQFQTLQTSYLKEMDMIQAALQKIEANLTQVHKQEEKYLKKEWSKETLFQKLNRTIMEELINKIEIGTLDMVTKTREINIRWNF